jgi:hypothetical protein
MQPKHVRKIVEIVCLGCLTTSAALAQPMVTRQPSNRFLTVGQLAVFSLGLKGTPPFTYQWLFDGTVLAGATNATLSFPNVQPAFDGDYSVVVSNASGYVTSQAARLKVFVPAPHDFRSVAVRSNRTTSLTFTGETPSIFGSYYDLYPLEVSSNLVDWRPLAALQRTNAALETLQFLDTDAPLFSRRFYRLATNLCVTPLPQPTGPYPVGTFSMLLTDPSRTNIVRHTNQQFMVTFSYPAVAQAGILPAKYVEPQVLDSLYEVTQYALNLDSQAKAFGSSGSRVGRF